MGNLLFELCILLVVSSLVFIWILGNKLIEKLNKKHSNNKLLMLIKNRYIVLFILTIVIILIGKNSITYIDENYKPKNTIEWDKNKFYYFYIAN